MMMMMMIFSLPYACKDRWHKVRGCQWSIRLFEQKNFQALSKVVSDWEATTSAGRLFHKRGAAALKSRSPAVLSRVQRTTSLCDDANRSRLRDSTSTAHCSSLARYSSAVWLRQRNTRTARRNSLSANHAYLKTLYGPLSSP